MRTATLDFYAPSARRPEREIEVELDGSSRRLERVAGGFEFTEGPVWSRGRRAAVQLANTNAIYRLDPELGKVTVFRSKSGYTGVDIGRYFQPGSNGLTFDPAGPAGACASTATAVCCGSTRTATRP